jgi:hypothetical protein
MNADGTGKTWVSPALAGEAYRDNLYPAWSPNSKRVAFMIDVGTCGFNGPCGNERCNADEHKVPHGVEGPGGSNSPGSEATAVWIAAALEREDCRRRLKTGHASPVETWTLFRSGAQVPTERCCRGSPRQLGAALVAVVWEQIEADPPV